MLVLQAICRMMIKDAPAVPTKLFPFYCDIEHIASSCSQMPGATAKWGLASTDNCLCLCNALYQLLPAPSANVSYNCRTCSTQPTASMGLNGTPTPSCTVPAQMRKQLTCSTAQTASAVFSSVRILSYLMSARLSVNTPSCLI